MECPQCKGQKFDPEVLAIRFKGKNIYDVLSQTVDASLELFESFPSIRRKLEVLQKVGLGYLSLGQSSTTLSGGEAQRVKLAKELVRPSTKQTLYILDEPTTGLHAHDINRLIQVLQELVDKGSTVLVIEHNMDLVKTADWIIDLGPSAGDKGGLLIGEGTPETNRQKENADRPCAQRSLANAPHPFPRLLLMSMSNPSASSRSKMRGKTISKESPLNIPRDQITVLTGPSGSGKSSLAFETLYAEGQRRYVETLPAYARQAIKQLPKPKADRIEGLSPAIALEQKTGGLNPRSTVGTLTGIYDHLRILYAHHGTAYCPETGEVIRHISKQTVAERVLSLPQGEKIQILAPTALLKKERFEDFVARLSRDGYMRIRLNGIFYRLDEPISYESHRKNEIYLVIDRLVVDASSEKRLYEAIDKTASLSHGIIIVARESEDLFFNLSFAVESTGQSYPAITPQTFSFNAETGMCLECLGLGAAYGAKLDSRKDFMRRSIADVLSALFKDYETSTVQNAIEKLFAKQKIDIALPINALSKTALSFLLNGAPESQQFSLRGGLDLRWLGLHPIMARIARFGRPDYRQALIPLLAESPCSACHGERLNPLARSVRIGSLTLPKLCSLSVEDALRFAQNISLPSRVQELLGETLSQLQKALRFLSEIGLHYISLNRAAPTLSGGELQRIRLASQLGEGLSSCLYILDEPTIGLHPHNSDLLLAALKKLRDLGNTLVLVEHDPLIVKQADYLFDFGPKAGRFGGKITAHGTIAEIMKDPASLTGAYLSGRKQISIPAKRRRFSPDIRIENASLHNLKQIDVAFAKSAITCFTGVSGSGKSTLVRHLLKPAAELAANLSKPPEMIEYLGARFFGLGDFEHVISIDQTPIGHTIRADVSTYTELQPLIRSHFAELPPSRAKGLKPGHFSPNNLRGMCRACFGLGYKNVDLQFLPSVKIPCEACKGFRINPVALEIYYKGKHFGQILDMTVEEALIFFSPIPRIARRLQTLIDVGLSYVRLGQEIVSLSGGEAQRIRLSRELSKREIGKTLYLIDEPTVGLHSEDIQKLLAIFHRLADKKNTLVLIEHNLDVIANADYVIDLGPNAGEQGGTVVFSGTPEALAACSQSHTGRYLKALLKCSLPSRCRSQHSDR